MELNIAGFVREDIWLLHEQRLPPFKAIIIKSLKIAILSVQGFSQDLSATGIRINTLQPIVDSAGHRHAVWYRQGFRF